MRKILSIVLFMSVLTALSAFDVNRIRMDFGINPIGNINYNGRHGKANGKVEGKMVVELEYDYNHFVNRSNGYGVQLFLPSEVSQQSSYYNKHKSKLIFEGSISIYKFHKINWLRNSSKGLFFTFRYGTGAPYFLYLASGLGYNINYDWYFKVTGNSHLSPLISETRNFTHYNFTVGCRF